MNSVGEGTLPIMVQGGENTRVHLDLEETLFTPGISKNLFSVSAACDMGLSAIFTKHMFCFVEDEKVRYGFLTMPQERGPGCACFCDKWR